MTTRRSFLRALRLGAVGAFIASKVDLVSLFAHEIRQEVAEPILPGLTEITFDYLPIVVDDFFKSTSMMELLRRTDTMTFHGAPIEPNFIYDPVKRDDPRS